MRFVKKSKIIALIHHSAVSYKAPVTLTYYWNFGVLALFFLVMQILTGIFLAMHYLGESSLAFDSTEHIMRDVNNGWLIRYWHANGASMFFFVVYVHMFRGLYYGSYLKPRASLWCSGVIILLIMILTAFLGYVLPWGQMSFWAATVITSLITGINIIAPSLMLGDEATEVLWGGYSVGGPTLLRFYSFHYLFPFILTALVGLHIILLHTFKSSNPLGVNSPDYIPFTPYFTIKDYYGVIIFWFPFSTYLYFYPLVLGHSDNFIKANPMVTPAHIVPEWYFLPFYGILRSVPDKLGGIVLLLLSIILLLLLPFIDNNRRRSSMFKVIHKVFFWFFLVNCLILGWIGGKSIEAPFSLIGQIATIFYFSYFLILIPFSNYIEKIFWINNKAK